VTAELRVQTAMPIYSF